MNYKTMYNTIKDVLTEEIINENQHVSHLNTLAKKTRKEGDAWLHDEEGSKEDNKGMQKMCHSDAEDYEKIAKHIANGKHKLAARHLDNMDTSARDRIGEKTYNFLNKHSR